MRLINSLFRKFRLISPGYRSVVTVTLTDGTNHTFEVDGYIQAIHYKNDRRLYKRRVRKTAG
jgi:hypothetical protein